MEVPRNLTLLRDNVVETMHIFRLPLGRCSSWCDGEPGDTILYTGCLYQTMEIVLRRGRFLDLVTKDPDRDFMARLAKIFMSLGPVYRLFIDPGEGRVYDLPRKALSILRRLGYEVGCLREEPYPGMLLYEFGFDREFREYAARVYEYLRDRGVKRLVTIDPHVYELMKYIYPEYVPGYDLEVVNYIDLVLDALRDGRARLRNPGYSVTYHDPCHYSKSKHRRIIDEPREIIKSSGVEIREPLRTRRFSMCCGGPIETYYSRLSREIAKRRLSELRDAGGDKILVACPICLVSFESVGGRVMDLIEFLDENLVVGDGVE